MPSTYHQEHIPSQSLCVSSRMLSQPELIEKQHANRLGQILPLADARIDAKAVYLIFLCLLYYVCLGQQCFHVSLGRESRYD